MCGVIWGAHLSGNPTGVMIPKATLQVKRSCAVSSSVRDRVSETVRSRDARLSAALKRNVASACHECASAFVACHLPDESKRS
eukprot:3251605-Pleurochrysis_carterae.AAC.2